ncbi:MAG: hypothetical protein KDK44_02310 [Chlamydiia bacterium]|nr:hypothetical protein [Chlamydiia bacterium]MCP5510060.1 hypothetical protein [Chlamydiales bacterium]
MRKTKEENFLLKLHELALIQGDIHTSIDCYLVGEKLGFGTASVNNIVQVLASCHFIKKDGDKKVHLSDNGVVLVNQLMSES